MTKNTPTPRHYSWLFGLAFGLVAARATAQDLGPRAPDTIGGPGPTAPIPKSPYRADWDARYVRAKADLVAGRDSEADVAFDALAANAPTPEDARRAQELSDICRSKLKRQADGAVLRTQQELTLLYSTAFVYGLGTSAWVALETEPKNVAAAVLPFAAITTASVGSVALIDGYRPFRRGVPQSISTGVYLGFGEGIWAVGYQHAFATRRDDVATWKDKEVASVLWGGATLGAIGGAVVGSLRDTTPGRVSFTLSTSLWGGLISSFATTALSPDEARRTEHGFAGGLIGYNVGLLGGLIFAPSIQPSIARVRFVDLGGLGGGLIGAGTYSLIAGEGGRSRAAFGASALGATLGLGLTWWATSGMQTDPLPKSAHDLHLLPSLVRTSDGWLAMVSGEL
ncbi:MAG TPA: hypothetical protein VHW01_14375 [Polyangiaceae bacterium]|nr:hypothetical protein [Polyangiaceae bacterium]